MSGTDALRRQRAEFRWDPQRLRLTWANEAGLAFWCEDSLIDLTERIFAPGDETVRALAARQAEIAEGGSGTGRLIFTPRGAPILTVAECRMVEGGGERLMLHVSLTEIDPPTDAVLARMQAGFDAAPQAMAIVDAAGGVLTRNEADRRCFPDASSLFRDRFIDPADAQAALATTFADGTFSRKALLHVGSDAAAFRISLRRMRDPVSGMVSAIAEFSDQTDRPALVPTPLAGSRRESAVAALAHDLRSPLMAVQGFAEFLALSGDDMTAAQRAGYLADIGTACRRLQGIIDQIIEGAAQGAALVALGPILNASARLHRPRAAALGASLIVVDPDPALTVEADAESLHRILDNLIGNALSHAVAAGGTVRLAAWLDGASVVIEVSDDGPGMADAALAAAMSPFGAPQPVGRTGGLGLPNCKALAEAMGARFEIVTAPEKGLSARVIFGPT